MGRLMAAVLVLAAGLSLSTVPAQGQATQSPPDRIAAADDIDGYVEQVMEEWKVPGLAIAVVKDGEVILAKGYGYRDVDEQRPVTARTLFAIGSITKSFTVTLLGMIQDEGRLDWDEPVRHYLPEFQLFDEVATQYMTPRDLVTHRSGLPRHDLLWYGSDLTRRELYERLRYLEPSREFRAAWQYQNLMFMTAGYLAEQIEAGRWEDLVKVRILEPLGMSQSNFSVNDMQKADDFAYPYHENDGDVRQIDFRNIDEIGPAGSINSSVQEMIHYVQFHIDNGKYGDDQLLSQSNAEQMQMPQMAMQGSIQYDELGHTSYGMGFFVTTYRGRKLVHHGGGIDGFISLLSFMPRERVGMIVLTNLSGNNPAPTLVTRGVYDRVLDLETVDWIARTRDQQARAEESESEAGGGGDKPVEGTALSHELAEYAGSYAHPAYGVVDVKVDGEGLVAIYNGDTSELEHFHYDVFELPEDPLVPVGGLKVLFRYNKRGEVNQLLVPLESAVDDIVFERVADESMRQRAFLEPFVGQYEMSGTVLTIELKGDALTLTVPGQPMYELVPTRGTSFDLKGLTGYSAEFRRDTSGALTELALTQPNGTFVAKRK